MPGAAKAWPHEQVVELAPVSAAAGPPPDHHPPDDDHDDHAKRPQPQHYLLPPADHAFHRRLSVSSLSDTGFVPPMSPIAFASQSPSPTGPAFRPLSPLLPPPLAAGPHRSASTGRLPRWLAAFWARNRAVFFVFFAQMFGSLMNLCARLLEVDSGGDPPLHPMQLLFVRMSLTTLCSCVYMYRARVPHAPFGPPGLRGLLLLRGLTNFVGIFCLWSAMMYLPLAEATVFSFLTPSATGYLCHLFMHHPFTRREQIASLVALLGVVLIARPTSVVAVLAGEDAVAAAAAATDAVTANVTEAGTAVATAAAAAAMAGNTTIVLPSAPVDALANVTATERLIGVGTGLVGVLGAASAYAAIRAIGTRAHPLVSVTYFSACCTLVSAAMLTVAPLLAHHDDAAPEPKQPLGFSGCVPASLRQCALLISVCVLGFCAQFLSTKGMGLERSNRATAMIYTQMLFAAGFDRFVFGHIMDAVSLAGCGLIIGGAVWAATARVAPPALAKAEDEGPEATVGHSRHPDDSSDDDDDGNDDNNQPTQAAWTHGDMELGHMPARRHRGLDGEERRGESARDPAESVPMLGAHGSEDDDDERSIEHQDTRI